MSDEDFLHRFEAQMAEDNEVFRQYLYSLGRPDIVAKHDERMRLERLGVTRARATWHSISSAQQRALTVASENGGRLERVGKEYRHRNRHQPCRPIHVATLRNLCARELMAWEGGAFDPEAAAAITERGLFVIKHGPMPNGARFTG